MEKKIIYSLALIIALSGWAYAARVTTILGKPSITKGGTNQAKEAVKGMSLYDADKVRCDAKSKADIVLDNGHRIKVWPKSEISLDKIKGKETTIKLLAGRIRAIVKKLSGNQKFSIKTPVAVCSVRGTDFAVELGDNNQVKIEVYEGVVTAKEETTGSEVTLNAGEYTQIQQNQPPSEPAIIPEQDMPSDVDRGAEAPAETDDAKDEARNEIYQEISREDVINRSAEEIKLAEYQNGKSAIDSSGHRVRLEEYIIRGGENNPTMTDAQFKYVVLNTRDAFPDDPANPGNGHFNFGKMIFSFNKTLPTDLPTATKTMFYKEGETAPDWYLSGVDTVMSNTVDQVNETATGGQMFADNPATPKTWTLGFGYYAFSVGTGGKIDKWWDFTDVNVNGTVDAGELKYYNIATGSPITFLVDADTGKYYFLNDDTLADETSNRTYFTEFNMPDGNTTFHFYQKNNYTNTQWISAEDYVLNDAGDTLSLSNMSDMTSSQLEQKAYEANFERIYTCSQFNGRKIDLLFSAKLLMDAGILNLPVPPATE
ncbi:MAG: FecR family protein [Elusimicrobiota bacterium]